MYAQSPLGIGGDAVGKCYTNYKKARVPKKGIELNIKKNENYKLEKKNRL
jgi:hypothetical protein